MKKIVLVILFILLFPTIVLAKNTCNDKDIIIKSITLKDTTGYSDEIETAIEDNKINLNIQMNNINDSITYDILVENTSNEVYYTIRDLFEIEDDYFDYQILNEEEVIEEHQQKIIKLKITYKNEIPLEKLEDGLYNNTNNLIIALSNKSFENPETKVPKLLLLLTIIICIIFIVIIFKKKILISILLIIFLPIVAKALCTVSLPVEIKIQVNKKEAVFLSGQDINIKMKELAGDDTTQATSSFNVLNENIESIKYSKTKPLDSNKEEKNIVSTSESPTPIYMWYEDGTIYWWSEAHYPKLNEDSSTMFANMRILTDVSDLNFFDTSNTTDIAALFWRDKCLKTINSLKNWDVSKVKTLAQLFYQVESLTSVEALSSWNTRNVTNMAWTFSGTSLENLHGLEDWDTSNLTYMYHTFDGLPIISTEMIKNWDTSKVYDMEGLFSNTRLKSTKSLENWNTAKVKHMQNLFNNTELIDLQGLATWDVSLVNNFNSIFKNIPTLQDASAINDWNIQRTAIFGNMFFNTPTHPEFNKVPGTWDSNGTFTPNP